MKKTKYIVYLALSFVALTIVIVTWLFAIAYLNAILLLNIWISIAISIPVWAMGCLLFGIRNSCIDKLKRIITQ